MKCNSKKINEFEEITVIRENNELIVHVFLEEGKPSAIVKDGFEVIFNNDKLG